MKMTFEEYKKDYCEDCIARNGSCEEAAAKECTRPLERKLYQDWMLYVHEEVA